jgi:peptidyl-prolyl cis-trans isomerase SurA
LLLNPETNTTRLSPDKMDRALFFHVDTMPLMKASRPLAVLTAEGKQAYRIVMVRARTQPHRANLKDDYQRIQEIALQVKQGEALDAWVRKRQKTTYIHINQEYSACEILRHWEKSH